MIFSNPTAQQQQKKKGRIKPWNLTQFIATENRSTFFIKIDNPAEFNFLQPYFLVTSMDKPRFGRILEMECLFSGSVWQGRQSHGYGYSCSADVYGTLIDAINKLYKKELSDESKQELNVINTHESTLKLSENLLKELAKLNAIALERKYSK